MKGELSVDALEAILGSDAPCEEREATVRSILEAASVMTDDRLRQAMAAHQEEINQGMGHWSDLAFIMNSIPRARGNAGPGYTNVVATPRRRRDTYGDEDSSYEEYPAGWIKTD